MRGYRFNTAIVAIALAGASVAFAACGDGSQTADSTATVGLTGTAAVTSTPAVTITATATSAATPSTSGCPDLAACDFGREVASLLANGQYDAVADRARANDHTCPAEPPNGSGGPFPLCFGAAEGEHRTGYVVGALQSEGAVESRDGLINFIRGWVTGGPPYRELARSSRRWAVR